MSKYKYLRFGTIVGLWAGSMLLGNCERSLSIAVDDELLEAAV